jgi:hypothetical protein
MEYYLMKSINIEEILAARNTHVHNVMMLTVNDDFLGLITILRSWNIPLGLQTTKKLL